MEKRDELLKLFLVTFGFDSGMLPGKALELALFLACDPDTPQDILELLAKSDHAPLLERIAEHPNAQPYLLEILAGHDHQDVRAAVSENPNVSLEILLKLCDDHHPDVRYRLAENPCLAPSVLDKLTEDSNPYVAHRAHCTLTRLERPEGSLRNLMQKISDGLAQLRSVG